MIMISVQMALQVVENSINKSHIKGETQFLQQRNNGYEKKPDIVPGPWQWCRQRLCSMPIQIREDPICPAQQWNRPVTPRSINIGNDNVTVDYTLSFHDLIATDCYKKVSEKSTLPTIEER